NMSSQIRNERNDYYDILERTQKNILDITPWMQWFPGCLDRAFDDAEATLASVLRKARFWEVPILFGTNFAPGDWHDICAMPSCVPVRFPGWHGGSDGQTTSTSFAA